MIFVGKEERGKKIKKKIKIAIEIEMGREIESGGESG
jgi:hypothetical protein